MAASCLSALSSAWVSGDRAQVRSCWRVRPWRAARDGRGRVSARKSWRREWGVGNGQWAGTGGEALGTGHKALGGEEELFESLAFASELEGMVGAAVGAGGLLLVCGWAGCGSEGVDWRGGSPTPRPSPPGEAGGGDWFSKRAREKSSRMGLVFRRRVDCDARRDVRVACVVFIPVIVGMAGAGAMGRSGWDGSLRALVGFGGRVGGWGCARGRLVAEFGRGWGASTTAPRGGEWWHPGLGALWRLGSLL